MRVQGAAGIVITEKPMTHEERRTLEACRETCLLVAKLDRLIMDGPRDPDQPDEIRNELDRLIKELSR